MYGVEWTTISYTEAHSDIELNLQISVCWPYGLLICCQHMYRNGNMVTLWQRSYAGHMIMVNLPARNHISNGDYLRYSNKNDTSFLGYNSYTSISKCNHEENIRNLKQRVIKYQ